MRYCKNCGSEIEFEYGERTARCNGCGSEVDRTDTITAYTKRARINQLKAMHELMCNANDEGIYMSWIYLMPDEPSEEDFEDIALDDEQYKGCFELFISLIVDEGNRW